MTNIISYEDIFVVDKSAILVYFFNENDECYRAFYSFQDTHTNGDLYVSDFESLFEILKQKYGEPQYENTEYWIDDSLKGYESIGVAIATGDLAYMANWVLDDMEVFLLLRGDNFETFLSLEYTSTHVPEKENDYHDDI